MQRSILIVDDDETDRYLLKRMIGKSQLGDVQVFEKTNGQEALEFLANHDANGEKRAEAFPPRLCFLDINMPLLNGWEFLQKFSEIRTPKGLDSMAFVMYTSSCDEHDRKRMNEFDFVVRYIMKGDLDQALLTQVVLDNS